MNALASIKESDCQCRKQVGELMTNKMKTLIFVLSLSIFYLTSFSQETGTFTDIRDGKVYKTVKIGTQWIMAENLAYKASNGCWAYNKNESNVSKYGYLYTWETAKNVCPSGWHLPSDSEWTQLTDYLGGSEVAGGKMKATTDWKYDANGNATNKINFNALPAGYLFPIIGSFVCLGEKTIFWSSTPNGSENAWGHSLSCNDGKVHRYEYLRVGGNSVRCVKN
jgi:uncharacterized protein (TIGR02145 family)